MWWWLFVLLVVAAFCLCGDGDDVETGEEGLIRFDLCGEYTVRHSSI